MQKDSKLFDDLARLGSSAVGSMLDLKREVEAAVGAQLEKVLLKMQLVSREEFEVAREIAIKAREENEKLQKRLEELEKRLRELASR